MKTRILVHHVGQSNAIKYYRQDVPLTALDTMYPDELDIITDDFHPATQPNNRFLAFHNSDIVHVHAATAVQLYDDWGAMKVAIPMWDRYTGKVKVPPMLVLDLDDRYTLVDHMNPSFSFWGIRRPSGEFMEPGDVIKVDTEDAGTIDLWADGKDIPSARGTQASAKFSVEANHKRVATLMKLVNQADMVTCSTPRLKEAIAEDFGREEGVIVIPNAIGRQDFPMVDLVPQDELSILWQGGWSHFNDMLVIREGIAEIARKYPHVKWKFFGQKFSFILSAIPEGQWEYIEWVEFAQHRLKLATIPHDIAVCPLEKTTFNDSKSAIKWYESVVRAKPAAVLASNWGAFRDEMQDGVTGMLFNDVPEFVEKLSLLIENAELRTRVAEQGKRWVMSERNANDYASFLKEAMLDTLRRHRRDRRAWLERTVSNSGYLVPDVGPNGNVSEDSRSASTCS